ncbi:MAG TPA: hypothetical protein VH416_05785 [Gaiellaceae bacterium]|jgi:hypothetical protein
MDRERIIAALTHAVSEEQERAALDLLRRWVEEVPGDAEARELLAALDAGDWEAVRAQLAAGDEAIARRAYEISQSPEAGTPEENWLRAVQELRGGG